MANLSSPLEGGGTNKIISQEYLTIKQAAEKLNVSRSLIYQLVQARNLGHLRVGGAVRIPADSLVEFINAHTYGRKKSVR